MVVYETLFERCQRHINELLMERNLEQSINIITISNTRRLRGLSNVNGTELGTEHNKNNDDFLEFNIELH